MMDRNRRRRHLLRLGKELLLGPTRPLRLLLLLHQLPLLLVAQLDGVVGLGGGELIRLHHRFLLNLLAILFHLLILWSSRLE